MKDSLKPLVSEICLFAILGKGFIRYSSSRSRFLPNRVEFTILSGGTHCKGSPEGQMEEALGFNPHAFFFLVKPNPGHEQKIQPNSHVNII